MIEGDEWKTGRADAPTEADMVKYASQNARLLLSLPWNPCPREVTVSEVVNGGEFFSVWGGGFFDGRQWYRTADVRMLAIIPPPMPEPETKPRMFPSNAGWTSIKFARPEQPKRKPRRKKK